MSVQLITIIALVAVFLISSVLPVHMGALAFVATFVIGTMVVGEDKDTIVSGFPGDLFVVLVGVTYLFAIAKRNGTIDWLVHAAVLAVRGRIALIPWMMFLVTAVLTAVGAVVPAAVAIIAPIGMGFATRYRINPLLMSLLIINGASAGGFSPISIFGSIVNGVVTRNNIPGNPTLLFVSSFAFNLVLSVIVFALFGGRELLRRGRELPTDRDEPAGGGGIAVSTSVTTLNRDRVLTLAGLVVLAGGSLVFSLDVGFTAITVAVVLSLLAPADAKNAVGQIAWPTVLLICGIVTYVGLMERVGTIDFLGHQVAGIGVPLLAGFLICLIGGAVSAFASTTGILGALIPLAVPFLLTGDIGAVGMIIALSISSSVVDSSPFSTSGALCVANAAEEKRDYVFSGLMRWGFSMVALAPVATWLIFLAPGWL
nr:SLC13 family permease [Kibdelosporangium sp. MJ126-NF4]CEL21778.1 Dicarboxylate-carrier protein [Kibdelosporangium sp. MJ126-NF4]CTQ92558.1 Dicarboxylate-carrier protein [Kibdelosporangium sp. MJ126-NF4]